MSFEVIDSHVHFWNPERLDYPWLADVPSLNRAFLPADLPPDTPGLTLAGVVFVQADCSPEQGQDEVAWVSQLADHDPRIRAIVAFAPLEHPETARVALAALRSYPLVRGIRRLIQSEPDGFAAQPAFIEGVRLLAEYGYTFDICARHHQLGDVVELVAACPQVSFVLDHIGKPDIASGALDPWREHISALAAHPNVTCKLSGLVTEADAAHWRPADLQPYIDHVLHAFGTARLMFGSDWPVVNLAADYPRWASVALDALRGISPQERRACFYDNARAFYRLP